ncbi:MAG: DUF2892 domain-containing protein [Balneolaceae bacterium]|nr:DUF2892 domain-containing protein [Balneolaceae bacterium]
MKKNMGKADRTIRSLLALLMIALYYFEVVSGTVGIVLIVISAIFLLTSFVSFCPLYAPFGLSTCKPEAESS